MGTAGKSKKHSCWWLPRLPPVTTLVTSIFPLYTSVSCLAPRASLKNTIEQLPIVSLDHVECKLDICKCSHSILSGKVGHVQLFPSTPKEARLGSQAPMLSWLLFHESWCRLASLAGEAAHPAAQGGNVCRLCPLPSAREAAETPGNCCSSRCWAFEVGVHAHACCEDPERQLQLHPAKHQPQWRVSGGAQERVGRMRLGCTEPATGELASVIDTWCVGSSREGARFWLAFVCFFYMAFFCPGEMLPLPQPILPLPLHFTEAVSISCSEFLLKNNIHTFLSLELF